MKLICLLVIIVSRITGTRSKWSEYGVWTSCSRSCGGGITYQERTCVEGKCEGESRTHRSCNIQDCPNGVGSFRKEQCAEYNSIPYNGKTYQWVPYSGALDNPCSLSCMPKNEFFYETFKEKVVDGTRCAENSYDMCVDGVCKKAGCDLILGSDAREDKCRVCNGRGKNCRTVKNTYKGKSKGIGYVDILEIPTGATNIFIKEAVHSRNYLALKNSSNSFIFNGNRNIHRPYKYKGAGTTFHYKRTRKEESIFGLGPTTDVLFLTLLSLGQEITIDYEYSIPKTQKVAKTAILYSWKVGEFGPCDKTCNGGTKTREVYCEQTRKKRKVKDSQCDRSPKPAIEAKCNPQPCPPRWFVGAWSPCSRSCEEGTQVRRVHCEKDGKDGIEMVAERLCTGPKAITQRKCVVMKECPKWKLGKWSECSKSCGGGIRSRTVRCMEENNNLISEDRCPEHSRPRDKENCNEIPCAVRWVAGDWGECRPSCGKGMRTRPVYCASNTTAKRRYPDYICNQGEKPIETKPCNNTASCPPMWYGSMWSKCTAKCGKGVQMRNVFCGVKVDRDVVTILSHENCSFLPHISEMQQCRIKPCYTQWIALSWQPCTTTCGDGKRLRQVKCYADNEEDPTEKSCHPTKKPPAEDVCNLVDCESDFGNRPPQKGKSPSTPQPSPRNPLVPTLAPQTLPQQLTTTRNPTRPQIVIRATTLPTREPTRVRTTKPSTTEPARTTRLPRPTTTAKTTGGATLKPGRLTNLLFPNNNGKGKNDFDGMSKPAEIVRGPENQEAILGNDVIMRCEATGNPQPEIFWLKGNLDVSVFGRRFQVLPNRFLKIVQVQEVDEDIYTCVANNAISRRSQPAYLTILTPPYVDISLGYTVKQGGEARIVCTVSGKPRPTVQWYKNGQPFAFKSDSRMSVTSKEIYIKYAKLEDRGNYDCKATNKNGERIAHMMLDVLPDEKTRLHDLINGNCKDSAKLEKCGVVGALDGYCDQPYYQKVCCKTCREKNKLLKGRLEGI